MRIAQYAYNQCDLIDLWLDWYNGTVEGIHQTAKYKNDYKEYDKSKLKKHFPAAKMISNKVSELLFNEPIKVTFDADKTTKRFENIQKDTQMNTMLQDSCKMQSSLGGIALKISVDPFEDYPILSYYTPDSFDIIQEAWGKVREIAFNTVIEENADGLYILRETHQLAMINQVAETDEGPIELEDAPQIKRWLITTELIKSVDGKNQVCELTDLDETAEIDANIISDKQMFFYSGVNTPNKLTGSMEGISDYHDSIDTFILIDQAFTSLYNDMLLGYGRILVDADMLDAQYDDNGKFTGYNFKYDQNLFTALEGVDKPEKVQMDIRFEGHLQGIDSLVRQAITQAKLSPSSFGYESGTVQKTAEEVRNNERNSYSLKLARQVIWTDLLNEAFTMLIEFDNIKNKLGNSSEGVEIKFSDSIADDVMSKRKALGEAVMAGIMSKFTALKELNPEWTEQDIIKELARINGLDPMTLIE